MNIKRLFKGLEQARSDEQSRKERQRRQMMTEEEVAEETARLWNDEFARHGIPHRVDSVEENGKWF